MAGDMSASDAASAAKATRDRGNALYKAGNLTEGTSSGNLTTFILSIIAALQYC
jgi:hypothetical protein